MGTKNNPGKFDCYEKLDGDEPYFILRANDRQAPALVRAWAKERERVAANSDDLEDLEKAVEATILSYQMEFWRKNKDKEESPL